MYQAIKKAMNDFVADSRGAANFSEVPSRGRGKVLKLQHSHVLVGKEPISNTSIEFEHGRLQAELLSSIFGRAGQSKRAGTSLFSPDILKITMRQSKGKVKSLGQLKQSVSLKTSLIVHRRPAL